MSDYFTYFMALASISSYPADLFLNFDIIEIISSLLTGLKYRVLLMLLTNEHRYLLGAGIDLYIIMSWCILKVVIELFCN